MKVCDRCNRQLNDDIEHWQISTADSTVYRCGVCMRQERIDAYLATGNIVNGLWLDANSCHFYTTEVQDGLTRLRPEVRDYFTRNRETLLAVHEEMERVSALARRFEVKHWLGTTGVQGYYQRATNRGHRATLTTVDDAGLGSDMNVLLWGSAGRVLMTFEDARQYDDPLARYGGATITLIFDEDSPTARGGIQSVSATAAEAELLLNDAIEYFRVELLRPDREVTWCSCTLYPESYPPRPSHRVAVRRPTPPTDPS